MKKDIFYNDYAKQLRGEYKKAYDQISFYVEVMSTVSASLSEIMNEVVDLLLSAQEDNRDVESVIGKDRLSFCKGMIEGYKKSLFHNIFIFMLNFQFMIGISIFFIAFSVLTDYIDGIQNPWINDLGIGGIIFIIILTGVLSGLFNLVRRWLVTRTIWYTRGMDTCIFIVLFICIILAAFTFSERIEYLIILPKWFCLLVCVILYGFCRWYKKQDKKKDIQDVTTVSFDNIAYNTMLELLQKKYLKYREKCKEKKIDTLDVKQWYEIYYKKDMKNELLGKVLSFVIVIFLSTIIFINSDFINGSIFLVIMTIFYILYYRLLEKGIVAKKAVYNDLHESDIDFFDEQLKKENLPL